MAEAIEVQLKGAIRLHPNDLAHLVHVIGLSVGGEAHDFVLVSIMRKTEVLSEGGIEDAERVGKIDAAFDGDLPVRPCRAPGGGGEVAHAIDGDIDGVFKRGAKIGGCEVGEVVLDVVHLGLHGLARESFGDRLLDALGLTALFESLKDELQAGRVDAG